MHPASPNYSPIRTATLNTHHSHSQRGAAQCRFCDRRLLDSRSHAWAMHVSMVSYASEHIYMLLERWTGGAALHSKPNLLSHGDHHLIPVGLCMCLVCTLPSEPPGGKQQLSSHWHTCMASEEYETHAGYCACELFLVCSLSRSA